MSVHCCLFFKVCADKWIKLLRTTAHLMKISRSKFPNLVLHARCSPSYVNDWNYVMGVLCLYSRIKSRCASLPVVYPLSTVRLGNGIGLRLNLLCVKLHEGEGRIPGY